MQANFLTADNPTYLFIATTGEEPKTIALEENNSLFAGSGSNCQIVLAGDKIEPIHCMFWMNDSRIVRVQDWNTEVGILVNGEQVTTETVLNSGDELQVAGTRIVPVLSPDVHQRFSSQLANAEIVNQVAEESTCNDQPVAELATVDIQDEAVLESAESESIDVIEPELEQAPVALESENFHYDVMADLDELDEEDEKFVSGFGPSQIGFGSDDDEQNEEVELLRMEVDQLRFELAERDARLDSGEDSGFSDSPPEENDQTIQLVNRLEELLEELQTADGRVRGLEDLLRVSDQATQAERDERLQLESWVTEIETRVGEREAESDAEMIRMKDRLEESMARHKQTRIQLKKVLQSKGGLPQDTSNELIPQFRQQVEDLEQRLAAARQENDQLRNQGSNDGQELEMKESLRQMEEKLLKQQVETSRESAEMARQHAELERLKGELEEKLSTAKNTGNGDARLREMRKHLREIHEEEKVEREEKRQRSLGGRISRLLGSVR